MEYNNIVRLVKTSKDYLFEKYISVLITSPISKSKFIIFPTPIYRKKRKIINVRDIIVPLREFAKIVEVVNSKLKNSNTKKVGIAANWFGSTK